MNTANTHPTPTDRPLGYWLRVVDALLTKEFATAFDGEGVTRRDWMLLNLVSGDIEAPGFAQRLARRGKKLRALEERGWITDVEGEWTLTDEGRAARERLGSTVDGIRTRVAGAVSDDDFATTMASLEAIARELGWSEELRMPRRGHGGRGRRGFGPGSGFGPGHGFGPGFGHHFGPDHRSDFGEGFGPEGHGGHRCGPRGEHGSGFAGHGHPHHRGHGRRRAERAYERGFDAGFARRGDAGGQGQDASRDA